MDAETLDLAAVPDRALDAALAEHLMGWRLCQPHEPFRYHRARGGLLLPSGPETFVEGRGDIPRPWRPSTNAAAALAVVEAMGVRGYAGPSSFRPDLPATDRYAFAFIPCEGERGQALRRTLSERGKTYARQSAHAPTFPRAVCEAALVALHAAGTLPEAALALLRQPRDANAAA